MLLAYFDFAIRSAKRSKVARCVRVAGWVPNGVRLLSRCAHGNASEFTRRTSGTTACNSGFVVLGEDEYDVCVRQSSTRDDDDDDDDEDEDEPE